MKLRFELQVPNFFSIPLKDVATEETPATGRVYFIHNGRIVAVARRV